MLKTHYEDTDASNFLGYITGGGVLSCGLYYRNAREMQESNPSA